MSKTFSIEKTLEQNPVVLAPMAAVSDLPFRLICREQGAGLCFTEMINAEAIARNNKSSFRLAKSCKEDRPLGLQLFGAKVESMRKAGQTLAEQAEFDFFDLNLGCPDEKVLRQGAGAALLKRPKRVDELIAVLREQGKPVTAKIRINPNVLHSIKFCKQLEKAKVDCITVHAKTVKQGYSGKANFVAVKRIVKAVGVPVIANGNIRTRQDVEKTLSETKVNGVMVGRAAVGNPGVFAELQGREGIKPLDALLKYFELCGKFGIGKLGKRKVLAARFLAKAKLKDKVFELQKIKTEQGFDAFLKNLNQS